MRLVPILLKLAFFTGFSLVALSVHGGASSCPGGTSDVVLLAQDVEGSVDGWSSNAWEVFPDAGIGGSRAFGVEGIATARFATLNAPFVDLPAEAQQITLRFAATRNLQGGDTDCFDGAVLETSVDVFNVVLLDPGLIQSDPYNGVIRTGTGNPYQNAPAWCGSQATPAVATVDLTGFAGESIRLSWTLAADNAVGTPRTWIIDDIELVACVAEELVFEDGFEPLVP